MNQTLRLASAVASGQIALEFIYLDTCGSRGLCTSPRGWDDAERAPATTSRLFVGDPGRRGRYAV